MTPAHIGQIDQIDQIDHLDPNLPIWHAVQDLYSTDATPETRARSCRLMTSIPEE